MLAWIKAVRANPEKLLFEPGFAGMLVNPFYQVRSALFRTIKEKAPMMGGQILDIGCGSKPYASLFTSVEKYIGIDIEISGHNHVRSKVDLFYDGKTLPFDDLTFDNVVSFETFEHIFNLDDILIEVSRILKENGHLMISIPFCWPEHEQPYDFARYTSFGIAHKLQSHGFEIVYMKKNGHYLSSIFQHLLEYIRSSFSPNSKILRSTFNIAISAPLNITSLFLSAIFPKNYDYYFGLFVICRKTSLENDLKYLSFRNCLNTSLIIDRY